jgi:hypothetical protein
VVPIPCRGASAATISVSIQSTLRMNSQASADEIHRRYSTREYEMHISAPPEFARHDFPDRK